MIDKDSTYNALQSTENAVLVYNFCNPNGQQTQEKGELSLKTFCKTFVKHVKDMLIKKLILFFVLVFELIIIGITH